MLVIFFFDCNQNPSFTPDPGNINIYLLGNPASPGNIIFPFKVNPLNLDSINQEHSRGSSEFPNPNLRLIGRGVHDRSDQTFNKQYTQKEVNIKY